MSRLPPIVREFLDLAVKAETEAELWDLTLSFAVDFGFEYAAMLHSQALFRRSPRLIRYENYPPGWDRRLFGPGHKIVDPILAIARRRVSAFPWPDTLSASRLTRTELAIIEEGIRFGIRQGVTIPTNVPGEPEGSVSFATRRVRHLGKERLLIADSVGRIAFDTARRIAGLSKLPDLVPHVSDRVRECIFWIAHGKTDQDIADILGIKLETVRTYVKSAFRTLNVLNRAQLAYEAVRLGLIDFVPSIPPFG